MIPSILFLSILACPTIHVPFNTFCLDPCWPAGPGMCGETPADCMDEIREWVRRGREMIANTPPTPECSHALIEQWRNMHYYGSIYTSYCRLCFSDIMNPKKGEAAYFQETVESYIEFSRTIELWERRNPVAALKLLMQHNTGALENAQFARKTWLERVPSDDRDAVLDILEIHLVFLEFEAELLAQALDVHK
ncbi:hypothetical protein SCOR_35090 [Sulfidibacter corallicola]